MNVLALFVAITIPVVGGFLSGYFVMKDRVNKSSLSSSSSEWYDTLQKPPWNPPRWVFGPAWTILYLLMGVASYLVWQQGVAVSMSSNYHLLALSVYALQLLVNFSWTPVFFGAQRPDIALIIIIVLWFMIIVTMILFYRATPIAMYLLIPYIVWVTYATSLNAYIVYKNDKHIKKLENII